MGTVLAVEGFLLCQPGVRPSRDDLRTFVARSPYEGWQVRNSCECFFLAYPTMVATFFACPKKVAKERAPRERPFGSAPRSRNVIKLLRVERSSHSDHFLE